jgi:hypothetical protein
MPACYAGRSAVGPASIPVVTEHCGPLRELPLNRLAPDEPEPRIALFVCLLLRLQFAFELGELGFAALLAGDALHLETHRFDLGPSGCIRIVARLSVAA